jgi:hypothetical protein
MSAHDRATGARQAPSPPAESDRAPFPVGETFPLGAAFAARLRSALPLGAATSTRPVGVASHGTDPDLVPGDAPRVRSAANGGPSCR